MSTYKQYFVDWANDTAQVVDKYAIDCVTSSAYTKKKFSSRIYFSATQCTICDIPEAHTHLLCRLWTVYLRGRRGLVG